VPQKPSVSFVAASRFISTDAGASKPLISLSSLKPNPGSRKLRMRVGRGEGSGKGGSAGRGMRGQLSRSGRFGKYWFEGGQTPVSRRMPKRGFNNVNHRNLVPVTLNRLVTWIKAGRIDPTQPITMKVLRDSGAITKGPFDGVTLVGKGAERLPAELSLPLDIEVSKATPMAKQAITSIGGSVSVKWYNRVTLRAHLKPEKFAILPRSAGTPPPRLRHLYPDQSPQYDDRSVFASGEMAAAKATLAQTIKEVAAEYKKRRAVRRADRQARRWVSPAEKAEQLDRMEAQLLNVAPAPKLSKREQRLAEKQAKKEKAAATVAAAEE